MPDNQEQCPTRYGVFIRVHDLGRLRDFYRETLGLGEPVVDSNMWTEFHGPGNAVVVLSHAAEIRPDEPKNGPAWLFATDDFAGLVKRLREREVPEAYPAIELPGCRCATFRDPEGNVFAVYSRA